MDMREEIETRCLEIGQYIAEHELSQTLAAQVRRILSYNKAVRHLRGGEATRRKYQSRKNESNGE